MGSNTATESRQPHKDDWRPNPGPQTDFLTRTCFEALYGGAAGGGKSDALLVDAIRYLGRGYGVGYHALLLRRTFRDLERSLIKRSHSLYPRLGGRYNEQKKVWRFPGGEIVEFGYLEHENDVLVYQGPEFQFVGLDELTHFSEAQYLYLISRLRSSIGVRCRMRASTNPGGPGHEWVFKRWGPWLDPECKTHAGPGQELYFVKDAEGNERVVVRGTRHARSRTFIPARLEDNPSLFADGEYEANLQQLDPVTRKRLRDGNWLVKPAKGLYFQRGWFKFINADEVPVEARRCRYWDRAATEPEKGNDPDWTSGSRVAHKDGITFLEDVARMRGNPGDVENFVKATAEMDGRAIMIGLEQEPGASGKADVAAYIRLLQGFNVKAFAKRTNKIVAAGPISAQSHAGNVRIVRGAWNEAVMRVLEQFPEGDYDDDVDSFSGAYTALVDTKERVNRGGKVGSFHAGVPLEDTPLG